MHLPIAIKIVRIVAIFRYLIGLSFQRLVITSYLIMTLLSVQFCSSVVLNRLPWQSASIDQTEYFLLSVQMEDVLVDWAAKDNLTLSYKPKNTRSFLSDRGNQ